MFTTLDKTQLTQVQGAGMLEKAGESFGFGAGVAVTAGLGLVPSWSTPVPGRPEGFEKRHESVVGPKVAEYANGLSAGPWKQFTTGVGRGATAAPGWAFQHGL